MKSLNCITMEHWITMYNVYIYEIIILYNYLTQNNYVYNVKYL